jgi:hypothetical protein
MYFMKMPSVQIFKGPTHIYSINLNSLRIPAVTSAIFMFIPSEELQQINL